MIVPHKYLFYFVFFRVFVVVLLRRVVCVAFCQLVTAGANVFGDSDGKAYFDQIDTLIQIRVINMLHN